MKRLAVSMLAVLAALLLVLGWHTRAASVVSFLLLVSLVRRNPYACHTGDLLLEALSFWAMFLPLGAHFSLDRLRCFTRAPPEPRVLTLGTAGVLLQIAMGVITAHYAVEGQSFFGIPLAQVLPYVVSRTVHTQIGIFWIATAWLATGLYVAPLLAGREPKYQKLGVDALFYALLVVVLGSTFTGWLGTLQHRGVDFSFWLGNQGLEFTSMGRVWQLLLFVGEREVHGASSEAQHHLRDDVALDFVGAGVDRRLAEVEVIAGQRRPERRSRDRALVAVVERLGLPGQRVQAERLHHELGQHLLDLAALDLQ